MSSVLSIPLILLLVMAIALLSRWKKQFKPRRLRARVKMNAGRYEKSHLTDQQLVEYANRITDLCEKDFVFLDRDLTLVTFSKKASISRHHLSQVFSRIYGKNFHEIMDEYRTAYAVKLLDNPANNKYTLENIAHQSGFITRQQFIRTFLKYMKLFPSEYKNLHRQN